MTCLSCVLLFIVLCITLGASSTLGVAPEDEAFYASGEITCPGTSIKGVVNDDYCDCPDGKDEPGTSACSNGRFYCVNKGYRPHFITSSRVKDSICDCCDGSDEAFGKCANTCAQKAEELNAETRKQIADLETGMKKREQFAEEYKQNLATKQQRQTELEQVKITKDQVVASLEANVNEWQAKIDKERETLRESLKAVVETEVEQRVASFLERRKGEVAQAEADKAQKLAEQQAAATETPEGEQAEQVAPEPEPVPVVIDLDAEAQKEREKAFEEIMKAKVDETESLKALVEEKRKVDDSELKPARDEAEGVKRELDGLKEWLSADFGPDARFAYMHGQTYTYRTHEYEYKLEPYNDAKQGHVLIGDWEGWSENYTVMKFTGGLRCWGGPDRSLTVYLSCGGDTEVLNIKEPSKCEYSMKVKTPGACNSQDIEDLKAQLIR